MGPVLSKARNRLFRLLEDDSLESKESCFGIFVSIAWEACFMAGLLKKSLPIPAIFGCHLRKEQSPALTKLDHQAVAADLDRIHA